ncbi:survival of motor neuron-related-splicing factor 30 [Tachypleus tridentatus]|uniref:survival of motor neuron-related-splicing factor 30 n=1 Tax=Tachypleus tridentatus TaxID=6853 RepID=UPI003FD360E4
MASEDLTGNLQNYQIQLQQVEFALTSDPENEELLKLKKDLEEVLNLTQELLKAGSSDTVGAATLTEESGTGPKQIKYSWHPGDKCSAPWSDDGQYYNAVIDDITEDGQCTVTFISYGNTDVTLLSKLRPTIGNLDGEGGGESASKSKKQIIKAQREYKKKKAQKKAQRLKQIEEDREKEKSKWQQFNSKAFSKNKKGQVKKSIFATPDNINGRVGVGTCGIGGRPMTEFHQQEKWKRPMIGPLGQSGPPQQSDKFFG